MKLRGMPSVVSFVTVLAAGVIAGCGSEADTGSQADPGSAAGPRTQAGQEPTRAKAAPPAKPGGTVKLVSDEGYRYSVRYDSFRHVTRSAPPPNVNFAIRATYTNIDDRPFALSAVMPDGRSGDVTLKLPKAAIPGAGPDPCEPSMPHDATHCTVLGRVDGDTYSNLAPGASGKATIRAFASEFAPSISRADVVVKFGAKELRSER